MKDCAKSSLFGRFHIEKQKQGINKTKFTLDHKPCLVECHLVFILVATCTEAFRFYFYWKTYDGDSYTLEIYFENKKKGKYSCREASMSCMSVIYHYSKKLSTQNQEQQSKSITILFFFFFLLSLWCLGQLIASDLQNPKQL